RVLLSPHHLGEPRPTPADKRNFVMECGESPKRSFMDLCNVDLRRGTEDLPFLLRSLERSILFQDFKVPPGELSVFGRNGKLVTNTLESETPTCFHCQSQV